MTLQPNDLSQTSLPNTDLQPRSPSSLPDKVLTEGNLRVLPVFPLQKGRSKRFRSKDGYRLKITRPVNRNGSTTMTSWEVQGPLQPSDKATFVAVESFLTDEYLDQHQPVPESINIPSYRLLLRRKGIDHPSQWDNDDLKDSLRRIHATQCTSEGTWKEKGIDSEQWLSASFHLYSNVFVRGETRPDGKKVVRGAVILLDPVYRASLNANHVIPLDYRLWSELKNPVARRLLEILSVKFYGLTRNQGTMLTQDYDQLCDMLPLEPRRYQADAKRGLSRAHTELVAKHFLAADPAWSWERTTKTIRYTPGERFYSFHRRRDPMTAQTALQLDQANAPSETAESPLIADLTSRGVIAGVARRLVRNHDADRIRHHLDVFDHFKATGQPIPSPGGMLHRMIAENWTPPNDYRTPQERQHLDQLRAQRQADEAKRRAEDERERIRDAALTPEQKAAKRLERYRLIHQYDARSLTADHLAAKHHEFLTEYRLQEESGIS